MHVVGFVIVAGWLAFWIYWLVAAVGVKSGRTGWTRFAGFRVGIILVVLLLVRVRVYLGRNSGMPMSQKALTYSAVTEERFMASRFPESYPEYKRSTKMLIPFVF
jgi:protein-S-isoprenylcysteine O-methyltransferase Ste14